MSGQPKPAIVKRRRTTNAAGSASETLKRCAPSRLGEQLIAEPGPANVSGKFQSLMRPGIPMIFESFPSWRFKERTGVSRDVHIVWLEYTAALDIDVE